MTYTESKFKKWLTSVDQICVDKFGIGIEDLPDYLWRSTFEDGLTPLEAYENFHDEVLCDLIELSN